MKDIHAELMRIHEKLDVMGDKQGEMNATLVKQHESLKYHIKRTDLLELEIKPIKAHVMLMNSAAKVIAVGSAIALFFHKLGILPHVL